MISDFFYIVSDETQISMSVSILDRIDTLQQLYQIVPRLGKNEEMFRNYIKEIERMRFEVFFGSREIYRRIYFGRWQMEVRLRGCKL